MKCKKCGINKLSKEFPPFTLTDKCNHPRHHCLRCVTTFAETHKQCSQCNHPVPDSSPNLRKCYFILERMFPNIKPETVDDAVSATAGSVTVTRVNGESFDLPYRRNMTIKQLKEKISEFMKVHPEKQSLLFNGNKLQDLDEIHIVENTLSRCGVTPNSTIHGMVLLYAVPSNLDKVVFDLYWGFPSSGKDYLDACAWAFEGQRWDDKVRFVDKTAFDGALRHSGDRVDLFEREGHQIIDVELSRIPSNITHIFFTLSSYSSRTISHFRNPSMKFYDASNPLVMLCEDKTNEAGHRQAIVMCSLQKIDKWYVFGQGALCDGNAQIGIKPMLETIQELIAKTGRYPHEPLNIVTSTITDPDELAAINARQE
ncbi:uncharacterized protein [Amphiura filiformis]|uniref:uncharacterized protein n=1 Tax=Amphiura filiformis TaxID=82378 RepID=UPI003B225B46